MTTNPTEHIPGLDKSIGKWIGIIPLLGSVLGYTITFVYETAYCYVYHIPQQFITLNWTTIILGIAAGSGGVFLVGWLYLMLQVPKESKKRLGALSRRFYVLLIIFGLVFMFSMFLQVNELLNAMLSLLILGVMLFAAPLLSFKGKEASENINQSKEVKEQKPKVKFWLKIRSIPSQIKTIIKKYQGRLEDFDNQPRINTPLTKYLGYISMSLLLVIIIYGFVFVKGRYDAYSQKQFYIPSTNQTSVVLRIYGDNIICAPYYRVNDGIVIERQYFVIKMSDVPKPTLYQIQIDGKIYIHNIAEINFP